MGCTAQVNGKIASLRGNATLLTTPACQGERKRSSCHDAARCQGLSGCYTVWLTDGKQDYLPNQRDDSLLENNR